MTTAQKPDLEKPPVQTPEGAPVSSAAKPPARSRRALGIGFGLLVVLGGAGIATWFAYNGSHHVSTDNARVAANTANITPEIPGRVLQWNVAVGTTVQAGQVIGQIDTSTVAQSSEANVGALSQTAPLTASRSLIRAPISGQIIQSTALVGQLVAAGQTLAVIADNSSAYVSANVKESEIGKVKLGQEVHVKFDALPGQTLTGRVQQIGQATASTFSLMPSGGADSGNFTKVEQVIPVSVYLTGTDRSKLLPGSSASVTIDLSDPPSTPLAVSAVAAKPSPLKVQISVVGTLTSSSDVSITPQVQGSVTEVGPQVGDTVKKGEVLSRLDQSTLRTQLAQAQAALSQVRNSGTSAQANLAQAASTLDRLQAVYQLGGVSRQDVQNAQTQYTAAQVAAQNATGGSVESAQAAVQNLNLMLAKTVITSPITGIVAARNVEVGEVAAPGVPIMTIVQGDPRRIVSTISASQASLIQTGQPVQVTFDSVPNRSFGAQVSAINPTSVATGDVYPIEARLDQPSPLLRAGMIATEQLESTVEAGQPVVPMTAIARIGAQNYVYTVENGKATRIPVQTGISGQGDNNVQDVTLTSGVASGTQVVSTDVNALWDGAPVQVR
ncbi:efflux RND transporter periplasmic adaptor subunit [Deinococcus altitudinis]|uniref:efflux RND transporter periplasmic adaptor subunit n=1 Tax=Deinococcus altitudinis TaxID=468914 RepID=UPI003891FA1E